MRGGGWIGLALVIAACGPQVDLEDTSGGADGDSSGTAAAPTTSPPPPGTTAEPPPPATTVGPVDTEGDVTTEGPPSDFPEYCSTIEQDCPPGYKCMPYSSDGGPAWNATICVEIVDDPSGPGEPCTVEGTGVSGLDDCDGTSMCWDVDPKTNVGTCSPFCIGDDSNPTCADPCAWCTITGDGVLTICLDGCDPITQDCDEGDACYPVSQGFGCVPDASEPEVGVGDPCEFINACPTGTACVSSSVVPDCDMSAGCCTPYCTVGGEDTCEAQLPGTACQPYYEEPPMPPRCFGGEVGICAAP